MTDFITVNNVGKILEFANEDFTSREISDRLQVCATYVRAVVRKHGIKLRRPKSDRIIDISGQRFGHLTAILKPSGRLWLCHCSCGNQKTIPTSALRAGTVISCGCQYHTGGQPRIHSMSKDPHYGVWRGMKRRCFNPQDNAFRWYGGRGIIVCDRWKNSFKNFFHDMGPRPSEEHSIDRIDNDGNYEPSNCRWATIKEQAANKRPRIKRAA